MAGQPRLDRLIQHDLGVLMTRPAQRHHEEPCLEQNPGLMHKHRTGAEVDLCGVRRRELQDRRRSRAALGLQVQQEAPHCRIAARIAVVALKRAEDRRALHVGVKPAAHQIAKRFNRGDAATRQLRIASEDRCQFGVVRQGPTGIEPAPSERDLPDGLQLPTPHQACAGNVAVGIALTHARQNLSILKHFEPPSTHRPSGQKARRYRVAEIRNAFRATARQNTEPATWLNYADPAVAPIRRSSSGPIAPIMHWLDCGDHPVARLRRSRNGSNMPVSDTRYHPAGEQEATHQGGPCQDREPAKGCYPRGSVRARRRVDDVQDATQAQGHQPMRGVRGSQQAPSTQTCSCCCVQAEYPKACLIAALAKLFSWMTYTVISRKKMPNIVARGSERRSRNDPSK